MRETTKKRVTKKRQYSRRRAETADCDGGSDEGERRSEADGEGVDELCAYEIERNERVARNKKVMEDLGILDSIRNLPKKPPKSSQNLKRSRAPAVPGSSTARRKSARLDPVLKEEFEANQPKPPKRR